MGLPILDRLSGNAVAIVAAAFLCTQPVFPSMGLGQQTGPTRPDDLPPWQVVRTLDDHFPFFVPNTLADWEHRREQLRTGLLTSLGLWPLPERSPLNAVIHGRIARDGYTVEKVYFESLPGFFVTGNLYRPAGEPSGMRPAVLCPHGHFRDGRFLWSTDEEVAAELASGGEQFASNARSVLQSRCATLARMGCVVFHYDMIGYADSRQIPFSIAHGFRDRRPDMERDDRWGLFSPQAELRLQSVMGLQTWNSIRALDFIESLSDVDPARIGVTGASGGGTQTFILCAIDPRPAVAFPAVMVSTGMQGGCTCENCCGLRVTDGNVAFAALFAPRPLAMTAADDWTREMEQKGFPELQQLYRMLGHPDDVALTARLEFGHNYNQPSREAMYAWFNRHLGLGLDEVGERPIEPLTPDQLTVWDAQHPPPPHGEETEAAIMREWDRRARQALVGEGPLDRDRTVRLQEFIRAAAAGMVQRPAGVPRVTAERVTRSGECVVRLFDLASLVAGLQTPCELWLPPGEEPLQGVVLLFTGTGTSVSREADSPPGARPLDPLLNAGWGVMTADLIHQNSRRLETNPGGENRLVPNGRRAAGYTFGYNRTVAAWRAIQMLDCVDAAAGFMPEAGGQRLVLVADRETSLPAALAAPLMPQGRIAALHIAPPPGGFGAIREFEHPDFQPGAVRYGDVSGLALIAGRVQRIVVDGGKPEDSLGVQFDDSAVDLLPQVEPGAVGAGLTMDQLADWLKTLAQ